MYRHFKTQIELKKYTRKVVDDIGVCHSLTKEHPHWDLFMYLFSRHSEYPEKCNGLVDIKIQYNPTFKNQLEVIIIKENGEEDDISVFDNCIRGKPKDNLTIAMRNGILSQILQFKYNSELICNIEKCRSTKKIVVDNFNFCFCLFFRDSYSTYYYFNYSSLCYWQVYHRDVICIPVKSSSLLLASTRDDVCIPLISSKIGFKSAT